MFTDFIHPSINAFINNGDFPSSQICKWFLFLKKIAKTQKDNYRPISILKYISKVHERILFKKIETYMGSFFSKFPCGFRKSYSTQQYVLALIEKWKSVVDKGKSFGTLLTDLSKAFACLPHELLIAKLHSYGFSLNALRLIHSYLTNRRQGSKINESYSSWEEILFDVPQGSILGPLLFNIFMCDLFFTVNDIDFDRLDDVLDSLENAALKLFD